MKRMAVLVAAGLVVFTAVPAAAEIDFGGKITSEITLSPDPTTDEWRLSGTTGLDLETQIRAEGGYNLRGVVEFTPWKFNNFIDDEPADMAADYPGWPTVEVPVRDAAGNPTGETVEVPGPALTIDKVYLQAIGPYWDGGPSLTTTLGDADAHWDDWVGWVENRGVMLEGVQLGPVNAHAFYFLRGPERPTGVQLSGWLNGIDVAATAVSSNGRNDYAFHGAMSPIPQLTLSGDLAIDADADQAYRVAAEVEPIRNLAISAAYRANDGFTPMFPHREEIDHDRNPLTDEVDAPVAFDDKTGLTVGLETTQLGVHVAAEYDRPTDIAYLAADTTLLGGVNLMGEAWAMAEERDWLQATLSASTVPGFIAAMPRVTLNGEVTMKNDAPEVKPEWQVGAAYSAPNGVELGATFHSEDGPALTAGMEVSF